MTATTQRTEQSSAAYGPFRLRRGRPGCPDVMMWIASPLTSDNCRYRFLVGTGCSPQAAINELVSLITAKDKIMRMEGQL